MKKNLYMFALLATWLAPLASCSTTSYETVNSFAAGVTMVVAEGTVSSTGLTVTFVNKSNRNGVYGEYFVLEKKSNGRWDQVPTVINNYGFTDIGYPLPPGSRRDWSADWSWLYGSLDRGEYRIVKEILDFKGTGDFTKHYLSAEFTI